MPARRRRPQRVANAHAAIPPSLQPRACSPTSPARGRHPSRGRSSQPCCGARISRARHGRTCARPCSLLFGGSAREAIFKFETTARLSPRDPAMWAILGHQALAQYTAGHYEDALRTADRAVAERPDFGARAIRIAALARLDRKAEAATALTALPKGALLQMPYLCPFRDPA